MSKITKQNKLIISEDKLSGNLIQIEMNIVNLYMMGGLLLVVIKWAMVELTTTSRLNIPHIVINTSSIVTINNHNR
jgi:hypothetical protein